MDDELRERAERYAEVRGLELLERLGCGKDGIVFKVRRKGKSIAFAVKILNDADRFSREHRVYLRLKERGVRIVWGFNVPQLLHVDAHWFAIEMTIVSAPFALDFASAYLDRPPVVFSDEIMTQWEEEKREQFEERWETVKLVLAALRDLGIHQTDVSPGNIGFE